MKKLGLIMIMLISIGTLSSTYADDLAELEALLNEESVAEKTTTDNTTDAWTESEWITNENTDLEALKDLEALENKDTSLKNEKIVLSTTWETTIDTVTLTFKKIPGYSNYKIYYAKVDENITEEEISNLDYSEKQVIAEDDKENVEVTIDQLEENQRYQFLVKAFDNTGTPIFSTQSEFLYVTTKQAHKAPEDNIIYDPVVKVDGTKVNISYKPWVDVRRVKISVSEDGQTFRPKDTIDASQTSYSFSPENTWKIYIKIVPVAEDGTFWVCKVGEVNVKDNIFTANVEPKKETQEKMWEPETGPELYFLVIIAILAYAVYALRKRI